MPDTILEEAADTAVAQPTVGVVATASNEAVGGARPQPQASDPPRRALAFRVFVVIMGVATVVLLWSLWVPLVLAAWGAMLARPLHRSLAMRVGGRARAAGVVSVALVLAALTPIALLGLSLIGSAYGLVAQLSRSAGARGVLGALLSLDRAPRAASEADPGQIVRLLQAHGTRALDVAATALGAATNIGVLLLVFVVAFYTFMVDGQRAYDWLVSNVPIPTRDAHRLAGAFQETGQGLIIGFGLTALVQAAFAVLGFTVAGVPNPMALGALAGFASLVPLIGTGLVTLPVTAAMFLADDNPAGIICLVTLLVTGIIDNPLRAVLSRYGQLHLPSFVVFISMLGGLLAFGAGGLLAGPLLARLSIEALHIWNRDPDLPAGAEPCVASSQDAQASNGVFVNSWKLGGTPVAGRTRRG